jgi:hypothetical protein
MADWLQRASDVEIDPAAIRRKERHFRRGFAHGAVATLWAIQQGASLAEIERWIDGPLYQWRYRDDLEEEEHAPVPKLKLKPKPKRNVRGAV